LCAVIAERAEDGVQICDDVSDELVAVGQCCCEGADLGQKGSNGAGLPLKRRDEFAG
jgi:hypothetical protein